MSDVGERRRRLTPFRIVAVRGGVVWAPQEGDAGPGAAFLATNGEKLEQVMQMGAPVGGPLEQVPLCGVVKATQQRDLEVRDAVRWVSSASDQCPPASLAATTEGTHSF